MPFEWQKLTSLTGGQSFVVERVRSVDGIAFEGEFEVPALAQLQPDAAAFVTAFVHCHGSIKQMEKWFGISYPTVKGRLNQIAAQLDFADFSEVSQLATQTEDVLDRLEAGEINVEDALKEINQ